MQAQEARGNLPGSRFAQQEKLPGHTGEIRRLYVQAQTHEGSFRATHLVLKRPSYLVGKQQIGKPGSERTQKIGGEGILCIPLQGIQILSLQVPALLPGPAKPPLIQPQCSTSVSKHA